MSGFSSAFSNKKGTDIRTIGFVLQRQKQFARSGGSFSNVKA